MGGWPFIQSRLEKIIKRPVRYIGRDPAASPATGFPAIFRRQQDQIIEKAVGPAAGQRGQPEAG
jgi:2-oxoglutarate dehydrogenase E1 component